MTEAEKRRRMYIVLCPRVGEENAFAFIWLTSGEAVFRCQCPFSLVQVDKITNYLAHQAGLAVRPHVLRHGLQFQSVWRSDLDAACVAPLSLRLAPIRPYLSKSTSARLVAALITATQCWPVCLRNRSIADGSQQCSTAWSEKT